MAAGRPRAQRHREAAAGLMRVLLVAAATTPARVITRILQHTLALAARHLGQRPHHTSGHAFLSPIDHC
jgi:hypothetical protein